MYATRFYPGLLLLISVSVIASSQTRPTVDGRPVVVELFTSEGCSSCPPADALLRSLNGQHTASGQPILVLSEHVTYWNRLGWTDPFSSDVFTARQQQYGQRFQLESVYTPQIVVNGSLQVLGSDGAAVRQAIQQSDRPSPVEIGGLSAVPDQSSLKVSLAVTGNPPENAELLAMITDDADASHVLRGENSGSTLAHVSVVRSVSRFPSGRREFSLPLAPGQERGHPAQHLVVIFQAKGGGGIFAARSIPIAALIVAHR